MQIAVAIVNSYAKDQFLACTMEMVEQQTNAGKIM